ncbi:hypothetical protein chiPu_0024432, partial [Chiloscyllium punctatum]|nr:hypothetical protein [Chiloscyllium punctatum]
THSLCEDTSSELQGVTSMETKGQPESRRSSFTGRGALARFTHFVIMVRNWTTRQMHSEDQRPDSFLERFRGPEIKDVSSRESNTQSAIGNLEHQGKSKR